MVAREDDPIGDRIHLELQRPELADVERAVGEDVVVRTGERVLLVRGLHPGRHVPAVGELERDPLLHIQAAGEVHPRRGSLEHVGHVVDHPLGFLFVLVLALAGGDLDAVPCPGTLALQRQPVADGQLGEAPGDHRPTRAFRLGDLQLPALLVLGGQVRDLLAQVQDPVGAGFPGRHPEREPVPPKARDPHGHLRMLVAQLQPEPVVNRLDVGLGVAGLGPKPGQKQQCREDPACLAHGGHVTESFRSR